MYGGFTASKELQTKYVQLQMVKQQAAAFIEEKNLIDEKVGELAASIGALNGLKGVKKGDGAWSSLGAGVFVNSELQDTERVLIGVGAGVVLKKSRDEAVSILESRLSELTELDRKIVAEINSLSGQMESLESDVQKLAEKEEK